MRESKTGYTTICINDPYADIRARVLEHVSKQRASLGIVIQHKEAAISISEAKNIALAIEELGVVKKVDIRLAKHIIDIEAFQCILIAIAELNNKLLTLDLHKIIVQNFATNVNSLTNAFSHILNTIKVHGLTLILSRNPTTQASAILKGIILGMQNTQINALTLDLSKNHFELAVMQSLIITSTKIDYRLSVNTLGCSIGEGKTEEYNTYIKEWMYSIEHKSVFNPIALKIDTNEAIITKETKDIIVESLHKARNMPYLTLDLIDIDIKTLKRILAGMELPISISIYSDYEVISVIRLVKQNEEMREIQSNNLAILAYKSPEFREFLMKEKILPKNINTIDQILIARDSLFNYVNACSKLPIAIIATIFSFAFDAQDIAAINFLMIKKALPEIEGNDITMVDGKQVLQYWQKKFSKETRHDWFSSLWKLDMALKTFNIFIKTARTAQPDKLLIEGIKTAALTYGLWTKGPAFIIAASIMDAYNNIDGKEVLPIFLASIESLAVAYFAPKLIDKYPMLSYSILFIDLPINLYESYKLINSITNHEENAEIISNIHVPNSLYCNMSGQCSRDDLELLAQ